MKVGEFAFDERVVEVGTSEPAVHPSVLSVVYNIEQIKSNQQHKNNRMRWYLILNTVLN